MSHRSTRRRFVHATGFAALGLAIPGGAHANIGQVRESPAGPAPEWLPLQDPAIVRETVTVSHFDPKRVREIVEQHPTLANAAVDWGFGDWEAALGAASHMGRRDIAEMLLAHGARASLFSAAMLGQLDVVQAFVTARPGIQRTLGPHGITLLAHAKAGKDDAAAVVRYLERVGDADVWPATAPLEAADRAAVVGQYAFGTGPRDVFEVDVTNDQLSIGRMGMTKRTLFHIGSLVFFPTGVPSLRIAFARPAGTITQLTVAEPDVYLTARRI